MSAEPAKYIWCDPTGAGHNRYVLFRLRFTLGGRPVAGTLNLFADTRYRLLVNGEVVCHGPARFFISHPEYDTVDLADWLRPGENVIAVAVNSFGCVSFQAEPSVGGLVAWGQAEDEHGNLVPLATNGAWRATPSAGYRGDTPALSFALNPSEYLDARHEPAGWADVGFDDSAWPPAVPHARPGHWGPLRQRSIPMLDEREVLPRRRAGTWAARATGEDVYSFLVSAPRGRSLDTRARVAAMTWIHSPRPQQVALGAWWGRYWLNGRELAPTAREDLSLRQDFAADLRQGWNLLEVHESVKQGWWDFYLGLPRGAGLTLSADRQTDSPEVFLIGGPWEDGQARRAEAMELPLGDPAALPDELRPWHRWPRMREAGSPCRERAWKVFCRLNEDPSVEVDVPALAEAVGQDTLVLLYDFGGEVLGRPVIDFAAAAGTVVDLTYTERLKDDGLSDVHMRHFVDMADRYIARDGRQSWRPFHPRGFRYMELLIRGDLKGFRLHRVALTRASYPVRAVGEFECSDPVLNEVWKLGRETQRACMEDAYLDCPWRERGLYSGDFLVQFLTNLATYGDARLFRRCIDLFFQGQGDNGLIRPGAHGLEPGRHPDYTAILPQAVWQYWARTGDVESLRQWAPRLRRLTAGMDLFRQDGDGELVDGEGHYPYVDLSHGDRAGVNCALNCFFQRGWHDAGRIFELLGDAEAAAECAEKADRLAGAIRRAFWDERRGVFLDRRPRDMPEAAPSVPGNALALLYDIALPPQARRAMDWLIPAMLNNFRVPDPQDNRDCNVTSYFSFYALGALYRFGAEEAAEQFIRKYWGRMLDAGAWTCWEYFVDGHGASRCHAWSSAPTHYLSSEVLGVSFPDPGNVNRVSVWPRPGSLQWAAGTYPHPAGSICVSWRMVGGKLRVDCQGPIGVDVRIAPPDGPRED